ncbi:class I SAM-dependent methyltransferase [Kribbella sp. NPDC004875]|uniref:class I SAM-dependent methyltransferase n=1 Tax=Kribbella sp. NPDC004875 TaxID=3364107 RepID=UPI00369E1D1D
MTQWNDLFAEDRTDDFDDFPTRAFLERALDRRALPPGADVLEYGCGTGPAACYLAARGFRVDAIDLIPEAITLARRFAQDRGVQVNFAVQDICAMPPESKQYDVVLDSYCLQSIVTDTDRSTVYAAIRARLKTNGYYVLATATYEPDRVYEPPYRYDATTGICYRQVVEESPDAVQLDGHWHLPHRRHLRPEALKAELEQAGLQVLSQEGPYGGELICRASPPR